jgi:hypothetical protein
VVVASYPEFLVLHNSDGSEHVIRYGPATSVALPVEPTTLQPAPAGAARRYRLSLALRELARRRELVRVELVDGTIEAVGNDHPEIAEREPGEARRRRAVKARRFLGLAAIAAVTLPPALR